MSQGLPNTDPQAYSPHLDFETTNQRKRTHSMAEAPQNYMHAQDQLHEYARVPAPNVSFHSPNATVLHAPIYDLPAQTGGAVSGLALATLDGYFQSISRSNGYI